MVTRPVTRVSTMGAGPAPWGPQEPFPSLGIAAMGLDGLLTAGYTPRSTFKARLSPFFRLRFLAVYLLNQKQA